MRSVIAFAWSMKANKGTWLISRGEKSCSWLAEIKERAENIRNGIGRWYMWSYGQIIRKCKKDFLDHIFRVFYGCNMWQMRIVCIRGGKLVECNSNVKLYIHVCVYVCVIFNWNTKSLTNIPTFFALTIKSSIPETIDEFDTRKLSLIPSACAIYAQICV